MRFLELFQGIVYCVDFFIAIFGIHLKFVDQLAHLLQLLGVVISSVW